MYTTVGNIRSAKNAKNNINILLANLFLLNVAYIIYNNPKGGLCYKNIQFFSIIFFAKSVISILRLFGTFKVNKYVPSVHVKEVLNSY